MESVGRALFTPRRGLDGRRGGGGSEWVSSSNDDDLILDPNRLELCTEAVGANGLGGEGSTGTWEGGDGRKGDRWNEETEVM